MKYQRISSTCVALAFAATFSGCSGGGGSMPVAPPAAAPAAALAPAATPTPGVVSAPNVVIHASSYAPAQNVDPADQHPVVATQSSGAAALLAGATQGNIHLFPVSSGVGVRPASLTVTSKGSHVRRAPLTVVNNPADVSYYGGTVLGGTVSHLVYVSTNYEACSTTCWGNPGQFLTDLGGSTFIGYLDQYIGLNTSNRYTKGTSATYNATVLPPNYPTRNPVISQTDVLLIVFYAAQALGTAYNYGNVYHVLLPPATDTCIDFTSSCYSPDNPNSFAFCGYHSSVDFGGGTHIVYTVEPYQLVSGCDNFGNNLNNATADTLSHEMFETITDPDVGKGWSRPNDGSEIGDICAFYGYANTLSGNPYVLQSEYSNAVHGCVND